MSEKKKDVVMLQDGEKTKRKRGRPPKLSPEQVERLCELALAQPTSSLEEFTTLFCRQEDITISGPALRRYLKKEGIVRVRPSRSEARAAAKMAEEDEKPSRYGYNSTHRDEGDTERYPNGLTSAEWELVKDLFETGERTPGRPPKYERRDLLEGCRYVVRTGCAWRMMPKDLPPWQNVYGHFRAWSRLGLFEQMHDRLRAMWREREHRDPEPTAAVIDSQSLKTSPQGGLKGYDAGKKVKGRKHHLVVDTLGLVLAVLITAASVQDRDAARPAMEMAKAKYPTITKGYADGGYAGKGLKEIRHLLDIDMEVVRHPRNRNVGRWAKEGQLVLFPPEAIPTGFVVLQKRWVVERTNAWNDNYRRLAKDQDRLPEVTEAWVWLAQSRMLLRRITTPEQDVI